MPTLDPSLVARFQSLSDEELVERRATVELTPDALAALDHVLHARGVDERRAETILSSAASDSQPSNRVRLEVARRQIRWLTTLFIASIGFIPAALLISWAAEPRVAAAEPSEIAFLLGAAAWMAIVVSFYISLYRTASTLRCSPFWMLFLAVIIKVLGWIVAYLVVLSEYRKLSSAVREESIPD